MSNDISVFGFKGTLIASNTFPLGLPFSQFADDSNPWEVPSIQVADKSMGINGDLISWTKANPILITINLIPNGYDDINFSILLAANRAGKGKTGSRDKITIVGVYPDFSVVTFIDGVITDGMPATGVSNDGRMVSKPYQFAFENVVYA